MPSSYTRHTRRTLLLFVLLLILLGLIYGLTSGLLAEAIRDKAGGRGDVNSAALRDSLARFRSEYDAFRSTLDEPRRHVRRKYPSNTEEEIPISLAPFDPNTVDSLTLRRLGLPAWLAKRVLNYRRKGGRFRHPDDFGRIYDMPDTLFRNLRPYIRIADTTQLHVAESLTHHSDKLPLGTRVDFNHADTLLLQRIPGIGSYRAKRIADYRDRLGGFHSVSQLHDLDLDTTALASWFMADSTAIQPIQINQASLQRLCQHPYINFYQARAIIETRRRIGSIHSLRTLALLDEFTPSDLERIAPYISFDEPE